MPMGPWEARLLNLERLLTRILDDLRRLGLRVAAVEQSNWQAWGGMGGGFGGGGQPQPAVLTTALATGTLASPSNASATLYTESGGTWTAGTTGGGTIYNTYTLTASIAAGKQVWYVTVNGTKYLLTANC